MWHRILIRYINYFLFTFSGKKSLRFSTKVLIVIHWLPQNSKWAETCCFAECVLCSIWQTVALRQHNLPDMLNVKFHHIALSRTSSSLFPKSCINFNSGNSDNFTKEMYIMMCKKYLRDVLCHTNKHMSICVTSLIIFSHVCDIWWLLFTYCVGSECQKMKKVSLMVLGGNYTQMANWLCTKVIVWKI